MNLTQTIPAWPSNTQAQRNTGKKNGTVASIGSYQIGAGHNGRKAKGLVLQKFKNVEFVGCL